MEMKIVGILYWAWIIIFGLTIGIEFASNGENKVWNKLSVSKKVIGGFLLLVMITMAVLTVAVGSV